jgi:hypothetical protein
MARCASKACEHWLPDVVVKHGAGIHVDGLWLCSRHCVENLTTARLLEAVPVPANSPRLAPLRLGTLLRHQDAVTPNQLVRALAEQRQTGLKLGSQVVSLGFADGEAVLRALATQEGVSYLAHVDPSCVRETQLRLAPGTVAALGLVPFGPIDSRTIKVMCTAPVPRLAVSALRQLTGLSPGLYLVTDGDWTVLADAYASIVGNPDPWQPVVQIEYASSLHDVAVRVAEAADTGRRIVVAQTQWDPYTWVRVESTGVIRDVLFARDDKMEEATPWPAVNISH